MRGRYCVKSNGGWWLIFDRNTGRSEFIENPAPDRFGRDAATSFLGRGDAEKAALTSRLPLLADVLTREGFQSYDELLAACTERGTSPPTCWAIVPDPNP
jgi:hypothetical protein